MIAWEKSVVETFLKVAAVSNTTRPAECLFEFPIRNLRAELRVQPVANEASLMLKSHEGQEIASWFIACSSIAIREDHDDLPYLLLEAPIIENRLRSWIAIGCDDGFFHVFSSAVVLPAASKGPNQTPEPTR